jgi:hypothetical protein
VQAASAPSRRRATVRVCARPRPYIRNKWDSNGRQAGAAAKSSAYRRPKQPGSSVASIQYPFHFTVQNLLRNVVSRATNVPHNPPAWTEPGEPAANRFSQPSSHAVSPDGLAESLGRGETHLGPFLRLRRIRHLPAKGYARPADHLETEVINLAEFRGPKQTPRFGKALGPRRKFGAQLVSGVTDGPLVADS